MRRVCNSCGFYTNRVNPECVRCQGCAQVGLDQRSNWCPDGCLVVMDEKVGVGRFRGPGWVRSVTEKEDRAIFDSIAVAGCPEGCLMVFDENGKV